MHNLSRSQWRRSPLRAECGLSGSGSSAKPFSPWVLSAAILCIIAFHDRNLVLSMTGRVRYVRRSKKKRDKPVSPPHTDSSPFLKGANPRLSRSALVSMSTPWSSFQVQGYACGWVLQGPLPLRSPSQPRLSQRCIHQISVSSPAPSHI